MFSSKLFLLFSLLFPFLISGQVIYAQDLEWTSYGGDPGGMQYSSLDQINRENVKSLQQSWIHDTGDFSDGSIYPALSAFESTPLMVEGVLYISTVFHRLLALSPDTGKKLWEFDPKFDRTIRVNMYHSRGIAYWKNGQKKRIFLADQLGRLFSVNTTTGQADTDFGKEGMVNLRQGMMGNYGNLHYGLTSPVAPCGNVVVAGSWVSDGGAKGPSGDIQAINAHTGERVWRFHTVPHPGEFGHDTWEGDSWKDRSGVNAWSILSVDEKRQMVFIPLTSPGTDFYGGDRKGDNLFSDSIVALDCRSGKRLWHFQTIHHDLWDWDLPSQPSLVTVVRNGREIPALAQSTKTGFIFLLDRLTGEPLFEVQERPVPQGNIPGEQYSPTQPFPVKPPPFSRQKMTRDEITQVTPESRAECLKMIQEASVEGPLFRPIGRKLTVMFPGTNGGSNWGGAAFDPESHVLYINSMDVGAFFRIVPRPEGSEIPFRPRSTKFGRFWDSNKYPCQTPPWGSLTAIDLNTGDFRWQSTLGEFDELTERGVPKTGTPNLGGPIVTSGGLVFIGATNDSRIRAFDKDSGEELWTRRLPASGHANPMTYIGPETGKQYVVIAAGGGNKYNKNFSGKIIAFALP